MKKPFQHCGFSGQVFQLGSHRDTAYKWEPSQKYGSILCPMCRRRIKLRQSLNGNHVMLPAHKGRKITIIVTIDD